MTRTARFSAALRCSFLAFTALASSAGAQPSIPTVVLRASDGEPGDAFGKRVAVSQGTLVVGAHGDDDRGLDAGAAYVFTQSSAGAWVERQKLTPGTLLAGDFFGWAVAIDGDVIVVGAPGDDRDASGTPSVASANRGAAYVFRRINGTWTHEATLQDATVAARDESGASVAVSGDNIMVGAIYQDVVGYGSGSGVLPYAGAVYAFRAESTGAGSISWRHVTRIVSEAASVEGRFGFSISLKGDRALIGLPGLAGTAAPAFERTTTGWETPRSKSVSDPLGTCNAGPRPAIGAAAGFGQLFDVVAEGETVVVLENCSYKSFQYPVASRVDPTGLVTTPSNIVVGTYPLGGTGVARSAAGAYWRASAKTVFVGDAYAGNPPFSSDTGVVDGVGPAARFSDVRAIDIHDATGDAYVIDGCAIRRITSALVVTTVAGDALTCGTHADATGLDARFVDPRDLQVAGDDIYIADGTTIRKLVLPSAVVTTAAGQAGTPAHVDGTGTNARFRSVVGLASGDGALTIADASTVRRMNLAGAVTTLAGDPSGTVEWPYAPVDGHGAEARVAPGRLVSTGSGRVVFVEDYVVREIDDGGVVRTIAGRRRGPLQVATYGYAIAQGSEHDAVGAPLSSPLLSDIPRVGTATDAVPALRAEDGRYGAAVAFTSRDALVLGPANGCVWTAPGTCVNHAIGTPREAVVQPVILMRRTGDEWRQWLALPTTGVAPNSQFGATLATEGALVFAGASEWDYQPQAPAPHGGIVGQGAVYIFDLSDVDSDGDGMRDLDEAENGLDPASATGADGAAGNPDGDGISNDDEVAAGTHPLASLLNTRYFAEGATSAFFSTEVALLNPGTTSADVLLRFQRPDGSTNQRRLHLERGTRQTIDVGGEAGMQHAEFSTVVESTVPIVADRVLRWAGDSTYGSHGERAIVGPALTWYLAEGATHSGFDLFYLLQNPGTADATVRIRYLRPNGAPLEKHYTLPAGARVNVWVNVEQFPEGSGNLLLATSDVSAVIDSTNAVPIVVERAVYLTHAPKAQGEPAQVFEAGHESAGVTAPSEQWFFAEGATGSFFDLFVLIANPSPSPASARVTYLLPSGQTYQKVHTIPRESRYTIWVDRETFDGVDGTPLADTAVSTSIEILNGVGVVAERALWWPGPEFGTWSEAHNSPGATTTAMAWAVAQGLVRRNVPGQGDADTYLLLANPGDIDTNVVVTVMFEDGRSTPIWTRVAARSRTTVNIRLDSDVFGYLTSGDLAFGATVESLTSPIVVEWAIYESAPGQFWAAGSNGLATPIQ